TQSGRCWLARLPFSTSDRKSLLGCRPLVTDVRKRCTACCESSPPVRSSLAVNVCHPLTACGCTDRLRLGVWKLYCELMAPVGSSNESSQVPTRDPPRVLPLPADP